MMLDERIARGANVFYWIAALSFAGIAIGPWFLFISPAGLGLVSAMNIFLFAGLAPVAYLVDGAVISSFVVLGFLARQRYTWAFRVGIGLYLADGLSYFRVASYYGSHPVVIGLGFSATILVVVHAVFLYQLYQAHVACRQFHANESTAASLDVQARLRRKLEEDVTPQASPPATFEYRSAPRPPIAQSGRP